MANKAPAPAATGQEQKAAAKAPEFFEIGELRVKHKVDRAVFAGVCSAKDWKPGKAVTEDEFLAAVREFKSAPMSGATTKKESEAKK